jgi:orotate phosphoribosyltransferase
MRPSVDLHFESLRMSTAAIQPAGIVLVDDVITLGRTMLAAAARAREAFPQVRIRGFALLRTIGLDSGIERVLEPCRGEIRWTGADAQRIP